MLDELSRRRPFPWLQALVLLLTTTVCVARVWWRTARTEPAPLGVVIVTLDTTRADHLPVYGLMGAAMPHLERLAREGVVFDQATSVAPLTLPAHCSLFTGLYPPTHGVRDNADRALAPERTTLAEVLHARGFRTGAFVGSAILDAERGLAQGFDRYSGVTDGESRDSRGAPRRQRPANEVIDDAERWLDGVTDSRFLLWAHLYDPHRPYDPPEPYRTRYVDAYTGEIAFADAQVGRLLNLLERRHLRDRTVVVVVADHGESLGDHDERDHGVFVYESVLRVPLIIRGPGLEPGRIADVVRLVDVMPTVLNLVGVPAPPTDGTSLVDRMRGAGPLDLEAYAESLYPQQFGWSSLRSLRASRYKLIEAPHPELYDLERDPFEQHNIYEKRRGLAEVMERRLAALGRGASAQDPAAPSAEVQERLATLGYVAGRPTPSSPGVRDQPDPKDCMAGLVDLEEVTVRASTCSSR
jgi:choline-sulfatase